MRIPVFFSEILELYLMYVAGMLASWYYYYILPSSVNKYGSVSFLLEAQYFDSFFCLLPQCHPQPRFYWQHELPCLVYKNLLTFRLSLAAPVTGLFKGCSKKLLDALTNSQICKAIQPLSEFNSSAINNRGKLLGLIHP